MTCRFGVIKAPNYLKVVHCNCHLMNPAWGKIFTPFLSEYATKWSCNREETPISPLWVVHIYGIFAKILFRCQVWWLVWNILFAGKEVLKLHSEIQTVSLTAVTTESWTSMLDIVRPLIPYHLVSSVTDQPGIAVCSFLMLHWRIFEVGGGVIFTTNV